MPCRLVDTSSCRRFEGWQTLRIQTHEDEGTKTKSADNWQTRRRYSWNGHNKTIQKEGNTVGSMWSIYLPDILHEDHALHYEILFSNNDGSCNTLRAVYWLGNDIIFNISLHIPDIINTTQKKYKNIESLQRRYAVYTGTQLPSFRTAIVPASSRSCSPTRLLHLHMQSSWKAGVIHRNDTENTTTDFED